MSKVSTLRCTYREITKCICHCVLLYYITYLRSQIINPPQTENNEEIKKEKEKKKHAF